MRNETTDREHVRAGKVLRDPILNRLQKPDKRRGRELEGRNSLRDEALRGIKLADSAASGQTEKVPALDGILDTALEIAAERYESLARLRGALEANDVAAVFRAARV